VTLFKKLKEVERSQSSKYKAGVKFERRVMKLLRKHGWHVMRRYGSWAEKTIYGKVGTDITAYKFGIYLIITCKYHRNRPSVPFDDPDWKNMVKYAATFGAIPVFAGVNEKRHIYFVDLRTMKEMPIEQFDPVNNLEAVIEKVRELQVYKRHGKPKPDKAPIEKLMDEAWKTIDLCNQMIESADNPKLKARWAAIKAQVISALNRVLWRAGAIETVDDFTQIVERGRKVLKEMKEDG